MNLVSLFRFFLCNPKYIQDYAKRRTRNNNGNNTPGAKTDVPIKVLPASIPEWYCYKEKNGIKYISGEFSIDRVLRSGYFRFNCKDCKSILATGITLYLYAAGSSLHIGPDGRVSLDYFAKLSDFETILENHSHQIYNIDTPYLIPTRLLPFYLNTLWNIIRSAPNEYYWYNKDSSSIFNYKPLYYQNEWTLRYVRKYRNSLNWNLLLENSSFIANESVLIEFYDLIPFSVKGESSNTRFNKESTIYDFHRIKNISYDFISVHFADLNIPRLLETANLTLSPSALKDLYNRYNDSYSDNNFIKYLCHNENFKWTQDLLLELSYMDPKHCWDFFPFYPTNRRLLIYRMITSITNHSDIIPNFEEPAFYLQRLKDGNNQTMLDFMRGTEYLHRYHAYSDFFTLDSIKKNLDEWNIILGDRFRGTHRLSTDHRYDIHQVFTMWNLFHWNDQVRLTFEIVDFLKDKEIVVGGEYEKEMENQDFPDYGYISKSINAVDLFIDTPFKTKKDVVKVCNDPKLLKRFLEGGNRCVIDYAIDIVINDSSITEFEGLSKLFNVS